MEELMQINVLKLFKTAITQLTNKNEFIKQNLLDSDSNLDFELKFLKDELTFLNSEISRLSSKIVELHQIQQKLASNYINQLDSLVSQSNSNNMDILADLEFKMKSCECQMSEIMNEKKRFVCNKFEFINEFLMKSHNIPGMQDEQTSQSEFEYSHNISNNCVNTDQSQTVVPPDCFKMKKQCEVCGLFGELNQATRSRIDKLSLCKSCAIFHDNHKKILFTEDTLNCSCFYNIGKCANKKLEAFKYLLENIPRFEIQEPCSEPSMIKKRRGALPKTITNQIHQVDSKRIKIENDQNF